MSDIPATPAFAYRAFISYSHADKTWADWLHKALETYRVPSRLVGKETSAGVIPRRLNPIFRDRDELASAHDLGDKVNAALAKSEALIVIYSPHSAQSRWVNEEVLAFKRLSRTERIFCLIVSGEPDATDKPGREAEECFCPALRFQCDAPGQTTAERSEPIAADARPGKDGKTNAKLKLIAGLLDVGFDALKQRELQRRNRRMAAITALALVVMTVTAVLAVFALISRHDAVIAQQQAVVAKQAAERRQKQAEGLVGFMLGDLNDKLKQVGRLDIMQAVDDKALGYFKSLPVADATDSALGLRVTALEKIGSVRMDQGKTPAALQAYRDASVLAAELVRRAPSNVMREAAYGDSLKWVGQAYLYTGDLANALKNFEHVSASLKKAHEAKPDDDNLTFKLAAAINDAGRVREWGGDLAAAQREYTMYWHLIQLLHQREPGNSKWQSYLGDAWNNLGKVELEQGHLDRAIVDYRADQQIKAAIAANDSTDRDAQTNLLMSNAILGRTLGWCGDFDGALRYSDEAVTSAKTLMESDPANSPWQDLYGLYSQQLSGLFRQNQQLDAATTADNNAVRVLNALTVKDPTNSDWPPDLAEAQLESARLQLARGDIPAAAAEVQATQGIIRKLRAKNPKDRSLVLLAEQADIVQGLIAAQRTDMTTARRDWAQARDLLAPALQAGDDPIFLAAYAETLLRLDQIHAARPIVGRLNEMGYRTPDFVELLASKHLEYPVNQAFVKRIAAVMRTNATNLLQSPDAARLSSAPQ